MLIGCDYLIFEDNPVLRRIWENYGYLAVFAVFVYAITICLWFSLGDSSFAFGFRHRIDIPPGQQFFFDTISIV